ncbi:BZ3500_MvSof-1268-A1-R1_Chr10-1g02692 [Microbotryum saponariae]|uniref:BZ3500_MvSof-1268-A1-R1_Chr10-1g02692 protein n=1 Tax=Microbotryum saponariae TaxID=289078 RepID=A0A2X0LGW2_9BASI|nr:BZ3500_MvSof-1268-A1-R1_Chr10-1g02692 [Microbotryum saponariae]SDA06181.1 BZ3501_MvSof-1269-A2-R1_Chr10-1g02293 [Microbotryum saponariae]
MSTLSTTRRQLLSLGLIFGIASYASASPFYLLTQHLSQALPVPSPASKHDGNQHHGGGGDHRKDDHTPITIPRDPNIIYDGFPRASSMVGWISIACWLILWLCVVQQSGEGLSLVFLAIWLAGDATNLLGALWQGLLPTMIILAVYYSLCDIVLIFQVFYYRRKRALYPELFSTEATSAGAIPSTAHETDPLLSSFSAHAPNEPEPDRKMKRIKNIVSYVGGFVVVLGVGIVAWRLSRDVPQGRKPEVWDTKAQVVGWASAFLYLGSRLPQISKNMETKCQGLSLLMFAFSVAGNGTYVASILLTSVNPQHILINASWLVGSGGTIFLDFIVLGQFWYYSARKAEEAKIFADDERLLDEDVA